MSTKTANAQQRILLAAAALFSRQGIRAAATKMSLYKYFSTKDELVAAYLHQRDAEFPDQVHAVHQVAAILIENSIE